jgi:hypothetical protein
MNANMATCLQKKKEKKKSRSNCCNIIPPRIYNYKIMVYSMQRTGRSRPYFLNHFVFLVFHFFNYETFFFAAVGEKPTI